MTITTTIMENDIQQKNLIQQATTRLRRLQLEEQLSDMMAGLENIQTQSKCLYDQLSHAMSTTQRLQDFDIGQQHQQMELLEIQCKLYQKVMLHQGFPSTIKSDHAMEIDTMNDNHDAASMSRHSSFSMVPSLFSSRSISSNNNSSISEFTDMDSDHSNADEICSTGGDLCATAASEPEKKPPMSDQQLHRYHRRLRVKYHRQRYQYRQQHMNKPDDQDSVLADLAIASAASVSSLPRQQLNLQQTAIAMHPLDTMETSPPTSILSSPPSPSPCSPCYRPSLPAYNYQYDDNANVSFSYYGTRMMDDNTSDFDFSDDISNIGSYRYGHPPIPNDDTVANGLLDQMDAIVKDLNDFDDCDESFFQDMAFLLDQPVQSSEIDLASPTRRHRLRDTSMDLPSSSVGSTINLSSESTRGSSSSPISSTSPYIDHLCHSGMKWCRFLSVLSASYVVSLLKGPDDLLLD
ncbi:hypothetical protein BCR42DRAFT_450613 [Absidia repens]|uniref:Uncharacterized protein n=1 Tax=Absidia repens TaxID=90262 RepID=A0A1X2IKM3_9FUNG|nr:hypothetical protein BCR42DRAFT_450613 [Absidia repens]